MKAVVITLLLTVCAFGQELIDESMANTEIKQAFRHFQPGPNVARALRDLEQQGRDLFAQFKDGHIDERTLLRERGRREIAGFAIKAWAFTQKTDEVATFAVLAPGELERIFPRGVSHLPKQLLPKSSYSAAPGDLRMWEYVGHREIAGTRFLIFRYHG